MAINVARCGGDAAAFIDVHRRSSPFIDVHRRSS
jgi:hypothetical protein